MTAGVISFCTHDARFLKRCIEGLAGSCDQTLVPVCDHFFDGTPENYPLLEHLFAAHVEVTFIEFAYSTEMLYGTAAKLQPKSPGTAQHWHGSSRLVSTYFLKDEITHILFCDVDEIAESKRLAGFLEQIDCRALRFAAYNYFRSATWRAEEIADAALLVERKALSHEMLIQEDERSGIFQMMPEPKELCVSCDAPLFHHYSWVRTREEALAKSRRWGHHWERGWEELINTHFTGPLQREDFIRKYHYKEAALFFAPLAEALPHFEEKKTLKAHREIVKDFPNVILTDPKEIWRKSLTNTIYQK